MKIIFTVNTYYPNRDGVQFVTAYLAEGLAKRGHSVELLTYAVAGAPQEETVNGVSVKRFNVRTEHMRHIGDKKGYLEYILSRQNDVDVIINVGTQSALTDWLLPVIKKLPVPAVLHIHSIWDFKIHKTDKSSAFALAAKLAGNIRWAYYFLRYSNAFKSYSKVLQLHSDDYSVRNFKKWYGIDSVILENAVEDSFFEPCPKEKYIVNVSNYMPMKNQRKLIEVFAKSGLPEPWKLVLIGSKENDYCRSLKKYAKELFGDTWEHRVNILTGISRAETVNIVKGGSIFVSASLREAYPISTLEAMAAGLPFLSYDVGIVSRLPGGIVIDSDDEYSAALRELAVDNEKAEKLGSLGRAFADKHCRIDKKVTELESIILGLGGND